VDDKLHLEQLLQGEEQYRVIFNASVNSMTIRGADFRIVDVNPAWEAMSGYARAEVVGRHWTKFSDPSEQEERRALHLRALAGEHLLLEVRGTSKNGRRVVREVRLMPIRFRGHAHVLQIGTDITQRKADEERLRSSEAQYRAMFDATADSLVLRDADYRVVDVNPAFLAATGFRREDVVGRNELLVIPQALREHLFAQHKRAIEGEHIQFEAPATGPDGRQADVEVRGVPMTHQGRPHVLYVGRDITQRKAQEARLRASEEQSRAIFNASTDALVLRDADFRIVDVNPAFEALSGHRREDVLGGTELTMRVPEKNLDRREVHQRALGGQSVHLETEAARKDGTCFRIEVNAVPMAYKGKPHVLYIGRDITERIAADAERAQLEAQLRQAQKMEAIGHLTGGIAHDFNNILQGILGNLTLAAERQEEIADPRLGKFLERAQHSAQRARELIAQMLTFSRGQRGARRRVSLPDLVRDASKLLRSTLPSTIDLRLRLESPVPPLDLDPVQLEQVVLNLCINARDAMRGEGAIGIGLLPAAHLRSVCASCRQKVDGRYVQLWVRDTGPGIPAAVLDRMFEPFYSTKEPGRGSGMGLSLAHGIVHEHGGHILVDSILNERTKFRVLLPVPEDSAAEPQPEDLATLPPKRRPRLAGRVLVVDDEAAIRDFMSDLLGGWGLEVTTLADGAAARDAVAAEPGRFDLVITDQTMPQLTGLALARELKRQRPGLPVILYTGYAEDLAPQELKEAGVVTLLRKPIEPAQFYPLLASFLATR
jgi:PAS domain S-box-containing protein